MMITKQHSHLLILRSCLLLKSKFKALCELENALDTEIHQSYLDTIYYQYFIIGGFSSILQYQAT